MKGIISLRFMSFFVLLQFSSFCLFFIKQILFLEPSSSSSSHSYHLESNRFSFFCFFRQMPYLNPARSLGPSFVLSKWDFQWIFWLGPLTGGALSGIIFETIFNTRKRHRSERDSEELSSMSSDEAINYDLDLEKPNPIQANFHGGKYNTYRSAPVAKQTGQQNMCQMMHESKVDRVEAIYGGTRSLYCKSPSLTRANLHRSQSVYTKSSTAVNRDTGVIRAGPLVTAQSQYPLRVAAPSQQNTHLQNQNVQNQLQQRTENIYAIRGSMRSNAERMQERQKTEREPASFQPIYGARNAPTPNESINYEPREEPVQYTRRPDSVYGMSNRRIQSAQSDDSSYGSYHGSSLTPPTRGTPHNGNFQPNTSSMLSQQQQQLYGMLPLPNPPSHHQQIPAQLQQQQQQQQNLHPAQQQNQIERKLSTSTNSSQQIQRNVEFKDFSQKASSVRPTPSPLPPAPPQHQNYQMHPIRQNN